MILPAALAFGAQLFIPVSDGVPVLNIEPVCQGIAQQGGSSFHDPAIAKEKQNCINTEKEVRDELMQKWSSFSPIDRSACVREATMGGESSYTELLTCLEMARDVRALHQEQSDSGAPKPGR